MQATGIEASACARLLRLRLRLWLSCRFCSDSAPSAPLGGAYELRFL